MCVLPKYLGKLLCALILLLPVFAIPSHRLPLFEFLAPTVITDIPHFHHLLSHHCFCSRCLFTTHLRICTSDLMSIPPPVFQRHSALAPWRDPMFAMTILPVVHLPTRRPVVNLLTPDCSCLTYILIIGDKPDAILCIE